MPYTIAIDARKIRDFGIGTYIRNLIRELAELDRENSYVLLTNTEGRKALHNLPENFRTVTHGAPVYSVREQITLGWTLYRLEADLYHATHYVLPSILPCPAVVTIHDIIHLLYPQYLPNKIAFFYAERMIRRGLVRGERVIAVSENTRDDLVRYFGLGGDKIEVVYNGIEESFRQTLEHEEIERWLRNLGIERPYALFVGNPKPHKNLDNVVKAFARALEIEEFPHTLVCVGKRDAATQKVRQRAEQLGLSDRLLLQGRVAQEALPAIYQGAELFLYPTLYEGFGLPVVEAMASGVPVVTSNTSALKEVAGGHAHLVNPLDVEGIAKAIARCLSDDDHRQALAQRGRERAEHFRWDKAAQETLEIYRRVLEGPADAESE